jgi:cobalt-zinc-cadmium efflux system protein
MPNNLTPCVLRQKVGKCCILFENYCGTLLSCFSKSWLCNMKNIRIISFLTLLNPELFFNEPINFFMAHNHETGHHHTQNLQHGRNFVIAVLLNSLFIGVEFTYGFIANSTALMADAGHNLTDVLGLILAWGALVLSRKTPSVRYTYGLRSSSILAALANAMLLLIACGGITWEAIQRFSAPPEVAGLTISIVAGAGIFVHGFSAFLFMKGGKEDLNVRAAFLHMAADAVVSLAVVVIGLIMLTTQWYWLDPAITLIIVLVIFLGTLGLLKESMQLGLNAVPANIDAPAIEAYLKGLTGVTDCHDLHIWGLSTTESALTVHLAMPDGYPGDDFVSEIEHTLEHEYSIQHSTLQIEQGVKKHDCPLTSPETD